MFAIPTSEVSESKVSSGPVDTCDYFFQVLQRAVGCHIDRRISAYWHVAFMYFGNLAIQISTYTASRSEAVADCNARGFVLASFSQKADANFAARLITSLYSMGWSPFLSYWTAAGLEQFQTYGQDGGYDPKCRLVWPNATPKEDIAFRCSGEEQSVIGRPTINGTWSYEAAYDHDSNHFICEMLL